MLIPLPPHITRMEEGREKKYQLRLFILKFLTLYLDLNNLNATARFLGYAERTQYELLRCDSEFNQRAARLIRDSLPIGAIPKGLFNAFI